MGHASAGSDGENMRARSSLSGERDAAAEEGRAQSVVYFFGSLLV